MANNIHGRILQYLRQVNFYTDEEDMSEIDQLVSTRVFIVLLVVSLLILICFTSLTPQTQTLFMNSPSAKDFDEFIAKRGKTPVCLCSSVSNAYRTFVSFNSRFHQVCSSDFISQSWISSLFYSEINDLHPFDFRLMASSQFQVLRLFCHQSQAMVENAQNQFLSKSLISIQAIAPQTFQQEIATIVEQFQTTSLQRFLLENHFISNILDQYQFMSALRTNFYTQSVPGSQNNRTFSTIYPRIDNLNDRFSSNVDICRCDENSQCIYPAGIYNGKEKRILNTLLSRNASLLFAVPGFQVGCTPEHTIRQSTLQCLYDQSCLQMISSLIEALPIVSPLDVNQLPVQFDSNTTVGQLFDQAMLTSWKYDIDFNGYFTQCVPQSCSYSYTEKFAMTYIITTTLGIIGGLVTILLLVSPLLVKFISRRHIQRNPSLVNDQSQVPRLALWQRIRQLFVRIMHRLLTLNLFKKDLNDIQNGIYSTRLYIILMIIAIVILTIYSSFRMNSIQIIIQKPTIEQFVEVQNLHRSTASCPCKQVLIPRSKFLSVDITFHSFCSSDFVREDRWLKYWPMRFLNGTVDHDPPFHPNDFRRRGFHFFKFMKLLCELAIETASIDIDTFLAEPFVTSEPVSQEEFHLLLVRWRLYLTMPTLQFFMTKYNILKEKIQQNRLVSRHLNNIQLAAKQINGSWKVRFLPGVVDTGYGSSCSCTWNVWCYLFVGFYCTSSNCETSHDIPVQTVPGLLNQCDLLDFSNNNLECFYNPSCVQMLIDKRLYEFEDIYLPVDLSNITAIDPNLFANSFPDYIVLGAIRKAFVAESAINTNYSTYFTECGVETCSYIIQQKSPLILIVTTVIGLLGGLNIILRLIVSPLVVISQRLINICRCRVRFIRQQHELFHRVREKLLDINLYRHKSQINYQRIATRIYLLLLIICLLIVSLFTHLQYQTIVMTVPWPNEQTFKSLHLQQSGTLSCRCSKVSNQYARIAQSLLSLDYTCIANFYSPTVQFPFIEESKVWSDPDWVLVHAQLNSYAKRCHVVSAALYELTFGIFVDSLVTINAIPPATFNQMLTSKFIEPWQSGTEEIEYIYTSIDEILQANQYLNQYENVWQTEFSDSNDDYILRYRPVQYNNGTCICATGISRCSKPVSIKDFDGNQVIFPGLVAGCSITQGLYQSTFECFFNETCIQTFDTIFDVTSTPLNSTLTRYEPNASVGHNIHEHMKTQWSLESNYTIYFELCAPSICEYSYLERTRPLQTVTTLLGIYGGLSEVLKIIVWYVIRLIAFIFHRFCYGRTSLHAEAPATAETIDC